MLLKLNMWCKYVICSDMKCGWGVKVRGYMICLGVRKWELVIIVW